MPAIIPGNPPMLLGDLNSNLEPRIGVMFGILFISLFAVSFPGISKQVTFLRIPHLAFFIGKHFGTGVILSTAFCHLLPDAFESLHDPAVTERYHGVGKWTGMIILGSLLSIFLVEYASTTYVDHLHSEPSAPSTPISSPSFSRPRSSRTPSTASTSSYGPATPTSPLTVPHPLHIHTTPSAIPSIPPKNIGIPATETTPLIHKAPKRTKSLCNLNHHRDEALLSLILLNSPRLSRGGLPHSGLVWGRDLGCVCPIGRLVMAQACDLDAQELVGASEEEAGEEKKLKPKLGRRRQVVGILVLQLGIMIHSFVIGLTLAVTSGADFTSLVTAIIFHQLFEGLSLGIRIASLPPPPPQAQEVPQLSSSHSDSRPPTWPTQESRNVSWLNPTLSILFAVTTPFGMGIGLWIFTQVKEGTSPEQAAHMGLTQGLLSAISAGMLIYAATVEMLAGDFVFGDIGGDHGHSHDHTHDHEHGHSHGHVHEVGAQETKHGSIWRKVLAVASLLAGVAGMGLVGLGE